MFCYENSQLILILRSLDKRETRELRKWLLSPFHNQREDVALLFDYLMSAQHLEDDKFLDKSKVFKKIFPGEAPTTARHILPKRPLFAQTSRNYLSYQEIVADERQVPLALARALRKRRLGKNFVKVVKQLQEVHLKGSRQDTGSLRMHYDLLNEYSTYLNEQSGGTDINLQATIDALDTYIIAEKLKQACYVLAHQKVYKIDYQHRFLPEVLQEVAKRPELLELPAINLYYNVYLTQVSPDKEGEVHFFMLRDIMERQFGFFQEAERRDIYLMALLFVSKE